ncbi:MAG TPA: hypothetical protein DDY13_01190 [Cytophagales bacterium]|jgi:hypothetical protein|nr:hypothetical protein [Cytophagales bacterium]
MKDRNKEIEKQLEFDGLQNAEINEEDQEAYSQLFSALDEKYEPEIPEDFAQKTGQIAYKQYRFRSIFNSVLLYTAIFVGSISVTGLALFLLAHDLFWDLTAFLGGLKKPLIFGISVIFIVQLADKYLKDLKPSLNHS